MKEKNAEHRSSTFDKTYVAVPLRESPLFDWADRLNTEKKFSHMTIYFMGTIGEVKLEKVKKLVSSAMEEMQGVELKPLKLAVIGDEYKSLVILLENTPELTKIRDVFEKGLPEFRSKNLPFVPHITIKPLSFYDLSGKTFEQVIESKDISASIDSYPPTSLGVYYRTDEDATALLYSKKAN